MAQQYFAQNNIWRNNFSHRLIFGTTIIHRERIFHTRTIRSCVSAAECVVLSRDNCLNKPRENNPGSNNIWRNNLSLTLNIWRNNFPWTLINRGTIFREIVSTIKLTVISRRRLKCETTVVLSRREKDVFQICDISI